MKKLITLMIVWGVLSAVSLSFAQQIPQPVNPLLKQEIIREFKFKKAKGITIAVLKRDVFLKRFGPDLKIPKTDQTVIQLAKYLYSPAGRAQIKEECGMEVYSNLYAALQNPDISDATRDDVDKTADAATPPFNKTYTEGHFKFYYTDNNSDPNHNVTENEIRATAQVLNRAWDNFTTNFKKPKHYISSNQELIDVKVYFLGSFDQRGVTSWLWDYIALNSQSAVRDACRRQTTPPHELFHRVQFAYGLASLTNLNWAVEGTAVWSEKFCAPNVGTWLRRMNEGLTVPNRDLITERKYDASHFWVYLGGLGKGEKECIRQVWSTYETNGNNMTNAVESVIKSRVPNGPNFSTFAHWWMIANFIKDMKNATTPFDYEEDELTKTCAGNVYGPLAHVPQITREIVTQTQMYKTGQVITISNPSFTDTGSAKPYGANYHVINLKSPMKVDINITGQGTFGFGIVEIRENQFVNQHFSLAGNNTNFSHTTTNKQGDYLDKIALMVMGNPNGGSYTVNVKASALPAIPAIEKPTMRPPVDITKKK